MVSNLRKADSLDNPALGSEGIFPFFPFSGKTRPVFLNNLVIMKPHFAYPLGHQSLRSNYQYPLDQSSQFEFTKNEPGLNRSCLTQLRQQAGSAHDLQR